MDRIAGPPPRREIELDLLRGIAILAVIDFHVRFSIATPLAKRLGFDPLGGAGVNIFFVLSGFLVGGLLIKEWRLRGRVDSGRFLVRRGFKIWPQYYLFLVMNVLTAHRSMRTMWPSFLNVQNYFPGGVAHLWSLAVEEHAYLLLTAILAMAWRLKMRMRSVFILLGVLSAIGVGLRFYAVLHGDSYFTPTHTRVGAIFYGVMIAIVFHSAPETFRRLQDKRWIWVGTLAVAFAFLRFNSHHMWTVSVSIDMQDLIGVSALMLIYRHQPGKVRSWPYRLVAWIGLYSYGIYLWHVSAFSYISRIAGNLPPGWSAVWIAVAEPLSGIVLGVLMTKLVEFPMLRLRERWFPRKVESAVEDTPAEAAAMAT